MVPDKVAGGSSLKIHGPVLGSIPMRIMAVTRWIEFNIKWQDEGLC